MKAYLVLIFLLINFFFIGCASNQELEKSAVSSKLIVEKTEVDNNIGQSEIVETGSYFKILKDNDKAFKVIIFDVNNNAYKTLDFPKEPHVEKVDDYLIKVVISTGSPSNYTTFYNVKTRQESTIAIFNLLLYENHRIVYVEDGKLIISDVFDKSIYYKEVQRDFSIKFSDPGAFQVEFIKPNKLQIKYLEGKDFIKKTEIIEL